MVDSKDTIGRLGQIVETSSTGFTVECRELNGAPELGSLVRCDRDYGMVYGVVSGITTESLDPSRRPVARDADAQSEDEVYANNPQLRLTLATRFETLVVGYRYDGELHHYLSPLPPPVYGFVRQCDEEEIREFTESLESLAVLLNASNVPQDDLVAAFLRMAGATRSEPQSFMVRAGKELAIHLIGQSPRLNGILRRLSR